MAVQPAKEDVLAVLRHVKEGYRRDHVGRLAAALAFYTALSLAPLIILTVLIAGLVFGPAAAEGEVVRRTQDAVGPRAAEMIQDILKSANRPSGSPLAIVLGVAGLLLGASKLFAEMQQALNRIWQAPPDAAGFRGKLLKRILSCAMVVGTALVLPVLIAASVALDAAAETLVPDLPAGPLLLRAAGLLVPLGMAAVVLALIYRHVPDATTPWRDVRIGAGVTAVLYLVMRVLVGLYMTKNTLASSYGAAASFVVVLLWLYYSSVVFYLGAELTVALGRRNAEEDFAPGRPVRAREPART